MSKILLFLNSIEDAESPTLAETPAAGRRRLCNAIAGSQGTVHGTNVCELLSGAVL